MTAESKTYNGWTNYETWAIKLHLDNDEGTYNVCREAAERFREEAPDHHNVPKIWNEQEAARFELADWLKDYTETLCGIGPNSEAFGMAEPTLLAQDLIRAAISEANFDEMAETILGELNEAS